MALVPKEHAASDASDKSDSECELHDTSTHYSSSPSPSIGSIENLNISIFGPDSEDESVLSNSTCSQVVDKSGDRIGDLLDTVKSAIIETVPLTPILQEIRESNYENVPSTLSAIPSLPSTPATPITIIRSRKTRSRQPVLPPQKKTQEGKKVPTSIQVEKSILSSQSDIRRGR